MSHAWDVPNEAADEKEVGEISLVHVCDSLLI